MQILYLVQYCRSDIDNKSTILDCVYQEHIMAIGLLAK
jgi:hypothetical protein